MAPASEQVDEPDVDPSLLAQRRKSAPEQIPVVAVVALGGGVGAAARYGASLVWPFGPGGFPWVTWGST